MENPVLLHISGIYHVHISLLQFFTSASSSLQSLLYKFSMFHSVFLSLCPLIHFILNDLIMFNSKCIYSPLCVRF